MSAYCLQSSKQFPLDVALRPFATFATFVSPNNIELLTSLDDLALPKDEPRQYFLWGTTQTGKSHLLQAICNQFVGTNQRAFYIPFKELTNLNPNILNDLNQMDMVCLDDVDCVLGNQQWDQALFQLINELRLANKSLLMTARPNPNEIILSLPDLASRLVWGPVYKLNNLTDQQKMDAVQLHAKARGFEVSKDVSSYLLKRYPRDLTSLIGLLDQLDEQSLTQQRKVTIPFVKSVLQNR